MSPRTQILDDFWPLMAVFLICGLVFVVDQVTGGIGVTDPLRMVPAEVSAGWRALLDGEADGESLHALATTFTYALLHADFAHILMNMVFIWMFGVLVLRELGAVWFFLIFIVTAITGGIGQVLLEPDSLIPTLGASGALLGLEGVYLGMALRWKLPDPDVWPISQPIPPERLIVFAAIGVAVDVAGLVGQAGGVAFGAHLGGFIGGVLIATTVIPRPRNAR